ncbi:Beta-galactosidase [compost metagenome]
MTILKPSQDWLSDVSVFAVNRLPAHSDHKYYRTMEEARESIKCALEGKPFKCKMDMRHSLNGSWRFAYSAHPDSRPVDFYKPSHNCSGWDFIEVPGHIQLQGYDKPQYVNTMYPWDGHEHLRPPMLPQKRNPVGSYIKQFELPPTFKHKPVYLSFQGVESAFYVWLNGHFIGYSEDSFTPAEFELTPYIQEMGMNRLAVEVYQRSTGSWLEDQDFWRLSGIFREVYLYTVPEIHISDLSVRSELDSSYSKGRLDVKWKASPSGAVRMAIETDGVVESGEAVEEAEALEATEALEAASGVTGYVIADFYDPSGSLAAQTRVELKESNHGNFSVDVPDARLWSAEAPELYSLFLSVYNTQDELIEVIPQWVGFRRFEMIDKVMHLNGKRIVFKGVNRHEFNCGRGRAITEEDMLFDILTLKQNNINAVRTSHYPNQSLWYELCDVYGIYVIDEMNLETHGSWQKMGAVEPSWVIPGDRPEWKDIVMDRAISMLERDKNHPSILIWSCGNESHGGEVIYQVSQYFRESDPGRLVHYEGVFHDRRFNDTSDMESRMYAKVTDIEEYLNSSPEKPFISCEYMHAMGNSLGGMHKYTELEGKYAMYQGGFIWDYIDQALLQKDMSGSPVLSYGGDFGDRATDYNFCGNGLVYADRKLSPKMQEVKFLYQNVKLMLTNSSITVMNDNLFLDTKGYVLECTLNREGSVVARQLIAPEAGPLEAIEYPLSLLEQAGSLAAGEYYMNASLKLIKDTIWADAGYEVAFGQHVFMLEPTEPAFYTARLKELRVVHGDVNIGIHGMDFSVMFSKAVGSLTSLNYAGREMIALPPQPLFWRAATDNDRGTGMGFYAADWFAASLAPRCAGVEVQEKEDRVAITFSYQLSISRKVKVETTYTVYNDGKIHVLSKYNGAEGLPEMPTFAHSFKLPSSYYKLHWLAFGPEENYIDRRHGARLCAFSSEVSDHVSGYLMPQESGNRTGVRRVSISNDMEKGIVISAAAGEPLECSISPFTAFELENARHRYELPPVHYTVVTVAGRQMGVGGDDSWGAPVLEEYRISSNQNLQFEFWISDKGIN